MLTGLFFVFLTSSFVCLYMATRPSREDKVIAGRLSGIAPAASLGRTSELAASKQLLKDRNSAKLVWLEDRLRSLPATEKLARLILQANSTTSLSGFLMSTLWCGLGVFAVSRFIVSFLLVNLPVALGGAAGPYGYLCFRRAKRIEAFNHKLADAIDMIARGLRAGHSMVSALGMTAEQSPEPIRTEFLEVFRQHNFGLPLRDALKELCDRVPSADLRVLVSAILVQKDTGGNLAEVLDRTVFVIRERMRIHGDIRVQTAQGRMTGWILSSLPIVMLVLINIVDPGYSRVLLDDPTGRKLIYAGVGLIATGAFFIRRITTGIEV